MIESGVAGYEAVLWFGLLAPTGVPAAIVERIARAANETLRSDEVVKGLQAQSVTALGGSPAQFRDYIETERVRWAGVIAAAGLKKE